MPATEQKNSNNVIDLRLQTVSKKHKETFERFFETENDEKLGFESPN